MVAGTHSIRKISFLLKNVFCTVLSTAHFCGAHMHTAVLYGRIPARVHLLFKGSYILFSARKVWKWQKNWMEYAEQRKRIKTFEDEWKQIKFNLNVNLCATSTDSVAVASMQRYISPNSYWKLIFSVCFLFRFRSECYHSFLLFGSRSDSGTPV